MSRLMFRCIENKGERRILRVRMKTCLITRGRYLRSKFRHEHGNEAESRQSKSP